MTNEITIILFLTLFGSILGLVGGIMFLYIPSWSKFLSKYSVPFAAGIMLTVALVGILPEAVHGAGEIAYTITLLSFIAAYLFEHFLCDLHHHENHSHVHTDQGPFYLVIIGDTIHNFVDGVAIAASYLVNPGLGVITTLSTFLHEVPHEIGDFGILINAGWSKKKVLWANIISACSSFVGALLVIFFAPSINSMGIILAISAGLFIYLASSDFLPHAQDQLSKNKAVTSLLVGVGVMLMVFMLVPHSHGEEDEHEETTYDLHQETELIISSELEDSGASEEPLEDFESLIPQDFEANEVMSDPVDDEAEVQSYF
jgi:zinc and cadmium transporter